MSQNTSSAVMQQRSEPHDSLDDFPTPPWATRALCEWLSGWEHFTKTSCREPAANRGHMVEPLREYFFDVEASDIFDYGAGFEVRDYLFGPPPGNVCWTITNPPFRLAEQFIERALETSTEGVAIIVRAAFLEGMGRYQNLFRENPPRYILQFTERVIMHKGLLRDPSELYWCEIRQKMVRPSTATAYCWLVWSNVEGATEFDWLAPCRKRLEKSGDYPEAGAEAGAN